MDRNNYLRLNPKRYEQYLSPYGKKVQQLLIKHWDKARNQNKINEYQHHQFTPQNKVLIFNNDSVVDTPYTPPIPPPSCGQILHLEEKSINFNLTDKTVAEIPRSVKLIKTISKHNDKDDFLHPTNTASKNLVNDIYNKDSDDDNVFDEVNFSENTNKNNAMNWDDMLDSELLIDMVANEVENKERNDNLQTFDIRFPNENVILTQTNSYESNMDKGQKRNTKKCTDPKTKKVRNDSNAVRNPQKPKLVKQANKMITDKQKNNFRKQKYTKAVTNWLDNVEPHHPVEKDIDHIANMSNMDNDGKDTVMDKDRPEIDSIDQHKHFNKKPITNKEKIVIDKTLNTAKKIIQAQLANKDGVMKYIKPKTDGDESKKGTVIKENKPKDIIEKKVKKFVAPIKSQIPVQDVTYEICTVNENNIENYRDRLCEIRNNEIMAVLIYSNGFCQLNSHHNDGTCAPDGIIISNDDILYCFKSADRKLKETLKIILVNNKVVCYGARRVLIYLAFYLEMDITSINMYDAEIGACLLDPDNPPDNFTDLQKLLSFTAPYTIATECMLQKAAWYISLLKECWTKLYGMLAEGCLWKVFVEIEMKLLPIIAEMELRGVSIDFIKLKSMEEILLSRMKLVEQQCYKAAGKLFQINSAVQVRAILYDELQLDTKCNVKIRETLCNGAKSTSETMLRSLISEHPLPKLILEYRHLHKAHATFLSGIAQHVKDGVVRPTWVQMAAATGRIACSNPNLQAIPKAPFSLVMFPDTGDNDNEQLMFRSVYVSREAHLFLAADFKHVECRVFAHAAADTGLLHALTASDDLFKVLAAKWLKKPETEVVLEERDRTKRLVYASLYGAGTRKLMEILDVDYQQALQVAASFNRTFPSLKSFGRSVVLRCQRAGGRLHSQCGRVRRFHNITSEHFTLKAHAERQAVNFIVQGSAADLCKIAMIQTEEQLRSCSPPVNAHLVLQIHDELVWEVKDQDVDRAASIIKQVMEGCGQLCGMTVKLPVTMSVGKNWGYMDEYTVHTQ